MKITGRDAKKLYRLAVGAISLHDAKQIFVQASRNQPTVSGGPALALPLLDAAVITYARPFTKNNLIGTMRLPKGLSPEEIKLHRQLMKQRNQAVAHADALGIAVHLQRIAHANRWVGQLYGTEDSGKEKHRSMYFNVSLLERCASLARKIYEAWYAELDDLLARNNLASHHTSIMVEPPEVSPFQASVT